MIRISTFASARVAVFGLGASGNATALALMAGGASVAAWDDSAAGREGAEKAGVPLIDLEAADWSQFKALVLAPGVPLTHPEPHWTVKKAQAAGIEIIGDIELFCRERRARCPAAAFIAITGTNGKSTTTALIAHILKEAGKDVQLGGNIGRAVLTLDELAPEKVYVIECSSYQIDLAPSINPSVGVLLNITPDHLDRHGTIENYAAVKERVVASSNAAVVVVDDEHCREISGRRQSSGRPFARVSTLGHGDVRADVWYDAPNVIQDGTRVADLTGVGSLRGRHNGENAAAAFAALSFAGLSPDVIARHMRTYPGLAHRLEQIATIGKTLFVNDSKATNAESTEKALSSWENGIFIILGGKSKDGGIEALRPLFSRISKAYLIGAASDKFAKSLGTKVPFERSETMDVAVASAARDAAASSFAEPVVLLSPACASFDQYKNFEVRGDHFRTLVHKLKGGASS